MNYERLPGSGDKMADGPGLMSPARGDDYDDGVRVYSDDASKPALINRDSRGMTPPSVRKCDAEARGQQKIRSL